MSTLTLMDPETLQHRTGEIIGVSQWFKIDQSRIDHFADTTEDRQFIHVDPVQAADSAFGGTIAHGFLTLSMLTPMMQDACPNLAVAMSVNYGFDRVRFLSPVKAGKRVRGVFRLCALDEKRQGQWQQKVEVTVEIDGEERPAVMAEWIFQHFV